MKMTTSSVHKEGSLIFFLRITKYLQLRNIFTNKIIVCISNLLKKFLDQSTEDSVDFVRL